MGEEGDTMAGSDITAQAVMVTDKTEQAQTTQQKEEPSTTKGAIDTATTTGSKPETTTMVKPKSTTTNATAKPTPTTAPAPAINPNPVPQACKMATAQAKPTKGTMTPPSSRPGTAASAATTAASPSQKKASVEINNTKPQDFKGEVMTDDELPSEQTLRKVQDYVVLDRHGKSHTFKSLYSGRNVARRVLVIFVRHFFCGYCQQYLRSLTESITPDMLLELPISTFIAVVGCGDPALIDMYAAASNCPFPIYTDPTRALYESLGMMRTLNFGVKPAYAQSSFTKGILGSVVQGLKSIPKGLVTRAGDARQVGGEFLFEPLQASAPLVGRGFGPDEVGGERKKSVDANDELDDDESVIEEKRMTWCHRMRSTRDHAEVPELMEILGLNGHGQPIKDTKRWSRAIETRKGRGMTLVKEMGEMREAASRMPISGEAKKNMAFPETGTSCGC